MHRVIIVGSPRPDGRSASLADELFNACIEECPEDGVSIVSVASTDVAPCVGCESCARALDEAPEVLAEGDPLEPCALVARSDAALHQCVIDDDMFEVRKHLDAADELIVVSPVYFAGAPAQLKALLDRMQPYFHSTVRRGEKRPLVLHVVGEGGDPHGFEPLVGVVRSAFAVAGFELELVLDWVGKIDGDGEIVAEADEYPVLPLSVYAACRFDDADADADVDRLAADADGERAFGEVPGSSEVAERPDEVVSFAEGAVGESATESVAEGLETWGASADGGLASEDDDFEALSFVGGSPRSRAKCEKGSRGEREAGRAKLSFKSVEPPAEGSSGGSGAGRGASSQGKAPARGGSSKGSADGKSRGKAGAGARAGAGKGGSASRKPSGSHDARSSSRKNAGRASGGNGGSGKARAGKGGKPASGGKPLPGKGGGSASGGKGGKRRG